MTEERLQEIKDSVNLQKEILLAHNMETLCVDEELELIEEIERLNDKIKRIAYQCYKSDMSYEEFKQIWVNAMGKIYEPSQIDELEKELGVDKE